MTETFAPTPTQLLRLRVSYPVEAKELLLAAFFVNGFTSLQEETEDCLVYYPRDKNEAEQIRLEITSFLEAAGTEFTPEFSLETLNDVDWVNRWKEFAVPVEIGDKLIICSNDAEINAPKGTEVIRLDPQLAFGTGSHPTTRMCLELMLERFNKRNFSTFLDVGCGSGILSIAAARLANAAALGLDIDPEAILISEQNAQRNNAPACRFTAQQLSEISGRFDLVCVNIISSVIINLWPEILKRIAPGGELVISGLLSVEAESFLSFINLKPTEQRENDGWLALHFTEPFRV